MKLSKLLFAMFCGVVAGGANAADITIFHSPTCPHCRHAREFIENTLVYEYDDLKVREINVMEMSNKQEFVNALFKCGYRTGGVPVLVIGEKCFQGYADNMQSDLRTAIEADLSDEQKSAASANRTAMANSLDEFIASHADRKNAITGLDEEQKKNNK